MSGHVNDHYSVWIINLTVVDLTIGLNTIWPQISEDANFCDCCTFFLKQNFRDKNFVNET